MAKKNGAKLAPQFLNGLRIQELKSGQFYYDSKPKTVHFFFKGHLLCHENSLRNYPKRSFNIAVNGTRSTRANIINKGILTSAKDIGLSLRNE